MMEIKAGKPGSEKFILVDPNTNTEIEGIREALVDGNKSYFIQYEMVNGKTACTDWQDKPSGGKIRGLRLILWVTRDFDVVDTETGMVVDGFRQNYPINDDLPDEEFLQKVQKMIEAQNND